MAIIMTTQVNAQGVPGLTDYLNGDIIFPAFINIANSWVSSELYYFEYPSEKRSGYYTVPCKWIPTDKVEHCDECMGDTSCAVLIDDRDLYTINEGYVEDFSYSHTYPIYGAWEVQNFIDFRGKCFVGDCNKANYRHVLCMNDDFTIDVDSFSCDKWVGIYGDSSTSFCVDGYIHRLRSALTHTVNPCSKPTTIDFFYVYNEWEGYEGYSTDWMQRWQGNFNIMNSHLNQYGINLQANFYEYQLGPDKNDCLPHTYDIENEVLNYFNSASDNKVIIYAGIQSPSDYGVSCPIPNCGDNKNPCLGFSGGELIGIPDRYDFSSESSGVHTLLHEYGHSMGCPHTGEKGSLTAHLYMYDIMSYGDYSTPTHPEGEYKYECKIVMELLGNS